MRWALGVVVAVVITGCSIFVGDDDDSQADCNSVSTRFEACDIEIGDALVFEMGGHELNTDTGTLTRPDGSEEQLGGVLQLENLYLVSTTQLDIPNGATLRVIGALPLAIAAQDSISVAGVIDASSTSTSPGAGANAPECAAIAAGPGTASSTDPGGGGGGGGGFGAAGGSGGVGDSNDSPSPGGMSGSAVVGLPNIRGGCPGGAGGEGDVPDSAPEGGSGGGAIYLVAGGALEVSGTIHAGGSGGGYGTNAAGGGGGGSGGLVGLEAPAIAVRMSAILAANGGGGGSGTGKNATQDGTGVDAAADDQRAAGGDDGDTSSGAGGLGGALVDPVGAAGASDTEAAGGGGGGAGWILLFTGDLTLEGGATVSPASQPN